MTDGSDSDETDPPADSQPRELDSDALADPTNLFAIGRDESTDGQAPDPDRPSDDTTSDLFDELDAGGESGADAPLDDMFEQMDVGSERDTDVWELLDDDADGDSLDGPVGVAPGEAAPAETAIADDAVPTAVSEELTDVTAETHQDTDPPDAVSDHVVNKRSYCQQCPHFSSPPDVACSHEGTTIVESVDFDRFRVWNCPMVQRAETDPARDR